MKKVYLALGSNIEPREEYLIKAWQLLNDYEQITVSRLSSIYKTAPVGYTDQANFLNMVIEVHTAFSPLELLDICQLIEQQLGRKRDIRFGPRTIDLDILTYNQENKQTERLTLPHPRMHERAFVLIPLSEMAPELTFTASDKTVSDYIKELPQSDIKDVARWTERDSAEE